MGKHLKVTLKRSKIGCSEKQIKTLVALGLRKTYMIKEFPDNPAVRGMLKKINHMVDVVEID